MQVTQYLYSTPGPCFPLSVDRQFLRLVLDTFSASQGKMSLNELGTSRWGSLKKKVRTCQLCIFLGKVHHLCSLKGLCHGSLVHWVNIAFFFAKELYFREEFTGKWQNHSFVSNKSLSQSTTSIVTNNKNILWKTVRLTSFQKLQLQSV